MRQLKQERAKKVERDREKEFAKERQLMAE